MRNCETMVRRNNGPGNSKRDSICDETKVEEVLHMWGFGK